SPNVGGLSKHLAKLMSGKLYSTVRSGSKRVLSTFPNVWELAKRTEEHVKGMIVPGTLFEELGFNYYGPVDGHDIPTLVTMLRNLKNHSGPRLLHITTKKGKGYPPAEDNPCLFHGVGSFDPETGNKLGKASGITYTQIFSQWVCDMAAQDERLAAITPAMCEGSGLVEFSGRFPARYHDVGIAEQHALTLAAGMACEGIKPVVAIYSTFLQRAYDQLIHDIALQNLPVLFAIDRAGLVGADGPTHSGNFDLSFMRCIPNLLIMVPADENECRQMLYTGFMHNGPAAVRYPRGQGPGVAVQPDMVALPVGKGEIRRTGKDVVILAFGSMLTPALAAAEQINASVANMRFVKPLDTELVQQLAQQHKLLVTIEENVVMGGAGSAVNEYLQAAGITCPVLNLGLPDHFIEQGSSSQLLAQCGLDASGIVSAVENRLKAEDK
ncbi:MAG: 1-deoxy-D-xylulose-5-phosphate synthase, partial [Pseudomonadota bacterium]|nr:1-deoxy-D-xylulose-5-phosphate synthase [Pseudomonadota bacterium]